MKLLRNTRTAELRTRKIYGAVILFFLVVVWYARFSDNSYTQEKRTELDTIIPQVKIQLIAVWSGNGTTIFLPQLFNSIGLLAGTARLLFVNRDLGQGCVDWDRFLTPNIQAICLKDQDYHELVAKFLCKKWVCSEDERHFVLEELKARRDHRNFSWRPLYSQIFERFLLAHDYSAWTDVDMMYGDLRKLPSYAFDGTFDVVTLDHAGPDVDNIYLRGQFSAFKRSEKMDGIWQTLPELANPASFKANFPRGSLDERYWSVAYMDTMDTDWLQLADTQAGDGVELETIKSVQAGLDVFQLPVETTREQVVSALDELEEAPFPDQLDFKSMSVVELSLNCPNHWLQESTTRCVSTTDTRPLLITARKKGIIRQLRDDDERTTIKIYRKFVQHFHVMKRRDWFKVPMPLLKNQVYEFSKRHFAIYDRSTLKTRDCVSFKGGMNLCPPDKS